MDSYSQQYNRRGIGRGRTYQNQGNETIDHQNYNDKDREGTRNSQKGFEGVNRDFTADVSSNWPQAKRQNWYEERTNSCKTKGWSESNSISAASNVTTKPEAWGIDKLEIKEEPLWGEKESNTSSYLGENQVKITSWCNKRDNSKAWMHETSSTKCNQMTDEKSWDNQTSDEKSWDNKRTDKKSWDNQRTDGKSWDNQRTNKKYCDNQRSDEKCWDNQRTHEKSWDIQRTNEKSWDTQSTHEKSWDNQRTHEKFWDIQRADEKPWNNQSNHNKSWTNQRVHDKSWDNQNIDKKSWDNQSTQNKSWDNQSTHNKSWANQGTDKSWSHQTTDQAWTNQTTADKPCGNLSTACPQFVDEGRKKEMELMKWKEGYVARKKARESKKSKVKKQEIAGELDWGEYQKQKDLMKLEMTNSYPKIPKDIYIEDKSVASMTSSEVSALRWDVHMFVVSPTFSCYDHITIPVYGTSKPRFGRLGEKRQLTTLRCTSGLIGAFPINL